LDTISPTLVCCLKSGLIFLLYRLKLCSRFWHIEVNLPSCLIPKKACRSVALILKPAWKKVYRDKFDLYCVMARDDAASNKLVGTFGFGDLSQYEILTRDRYPWVNTMRDAIIAKGIDEAKVDAASAIYVHADYTGQNIATTMMGKRATYQLARGITHAVSFAYESTDMKNWSAGRTSAEEMGTDGDGNKIYFFDLDQLKM